MNISIKINQQYDAAWNIFGFVALQSLHEVFGLCSIVCWYHVHRDSVIQMNAPATTSVDFSWLCEAKKFTLISCYSFTLSLPLVGVW